MKAESIEKLVELQTEFQDACENVCKHLVSLNDDFKHYYEFEIDKANDQIACKGHYTVMNESQYVYNAFPLEWITYTNEQLDELVIKKLVEQSDMKTLRELSDKYGYKIIKL